MEEKRIPRSLSVSFLSDRHIQRTAVEEPVSLVSCASDR